MRNLKKVLALVLAMAMSLSLAVTAGAAFNDQDKIVNEEAVEVCSALNIINGRTNGDFDPAGNVTRAEAAKMICIALNGGKEPVLSASATPIFADIAGHWAAKYIEYCVSEGIVAGKSATSFDPNGNVTGVELAKMLLIALGYNAEHGKFLGANWDTNVNVVASQKDLYEGLETIDPSVALSRDNAAQMIWNALQALTVKYEYTLIGSDGNLNSQIKVVDTASTLLWAKYKALIEDAGIMEGVVYDEKNDDYNTSVSGLADFDADEDYSALMGQNVKVVYKPELVNGNVAGVDTLYGVYATDKNEIVTGMIGDGEFSDNYNTVEYEGEEYDITGIQAFAPNGAPVTADAFPGVWTNYPYFEVSIINNDKNVDDVFECAILTPYTVDKVDYVGAKTFTTENGVAPFEFEEVNVYEGVAEDDYVVIVDAAYTVDDTTVITKADVVTGEVTVVNAAEGEYTIGDEVYTIAPGADASDLVLTYEVEAVVVNGYIFFAEKVDGAVTMDDVVYVTLAKVDNDYATQTVIAKATFADGTAAEIEVVEFNGVKDSALIKKVSDNAKYEALMGLYKYEVEDGEYTLTSITVDKNAAEGDYDAAYSTAKAGDGKIAGQRANDDAVVFVKNSKNEISVVTGADVKAWDETTLKGAYAYANETSGVQYVELAIVALTTEDLPGETADAVYGYVTKVLGQTKSDDTVWNSYVIWTATGEQTIKVDEDKDDADAIVGDYVVFEDGELADAVAVDPEVSVATITGIATDGTLFFDEVAGEFVTTDDTQTIYINAADEKGAEGGALKVAKDLNSQGDLEENVYGVAKYNSSDEVYELIFLFVDINNDINDTLNAPVAE